MPQRRTVLTGLAAAGLLPLASRAFAEGNPVEPDSLHTGSGDLIVQPVTHAKCSVAGSRGTLATSHSSRLKPASLAAR